MEFLIFIKNIKTDAVFNVKTFNKYFNTNFGQKIWRFLMQSEVIKRMAYFADAGVTSAEAIDGQMYSLFKKELEELKKKDKYLIEYDMFKKMIGRMIKEILLHNGYELTSRNCKVRNGKVFSFASKYSYKSK
jgi:hypothetical protein